MKLKTIGTETIEFQYWVTTPLKQIFKDTEMPPEKENEAVKLVAARGETCTAQIVLKCEGEAHTVFVEPETLKHNEHKGSIPDRMWEVHWVDYFYVKINSKATPAEQLIRTAPAEYPDKLRRSRVGKLSTNINQPLFFQLSVPKDAEAGVYEGAIRIRALTEKGGLRFTIPVRLEVLPIDFPEFTRLNVSLWLNTGALAEAYGTEKWSETFWSILQVYAKDMARHHQNVILTPLETIQVFFNKSSGEFTFRFDRLERWIQIFSEAGVLTRGRLEFGHIGRRSNNNDWPSAFVFHTIWAQVIDENGNVTEEKVEVPIPTLVKSLYDYLERKGLLEKSLIHIADEPIPENEDSWKKLSEQVHEAAPKFRRIDAITTHNLESHLEVWIPLLDLFDVKYDHFKSIQKKGNELWFYTCWSPQGSYPNRLMDYPLIKTRLLHWINFIYGATGYLHWGYNFWLTPFYKHSPGDNWIVWPGEEGPESSLRYEAMRQGIEDYEYFMMLVEATNDICENIANFRGIPYVRRTESYGDGAKIEDLWDPRLRAMELARQAIRNITTYTWDDELLLNIRETVQRELVQMKEKPWVIVKTTPGADECVDADTEYADICVEGYVEPGVTATITYNEKADNRFVSKKAEVHIDSNGYFKENVRLHRDSLRISLHLTNGTDEKTIEREWRSARR